MRNRMLCLVAGLSVLLIFSNAQAADDEQAAFDAVAGSAKAQIQARDNSREAIAEAVQAQTEKVYAACEDYLKRFPAGAHVDQVRLLDLDARVMLGTQMEKHRDLLDGVPALAEAAMKTSPTVDRKLRVHHALWRYNNAKAALAATPEETRPFLNAAIKEAEAIIADLPKNPNTDQVRVQVLDFLESMYLYVGREKDAIAILNRMAEDYPGTPVEVKAKRVLGQLALKGTSPELVFTSAAGEKIDLKNYRGKVVLVDFWASWCGPCKASMPILLEAEKKFRDQGFAVIGISFDRSREAMDAYVKAQGMPWPQLFGGQTEQGQAGEAFFITGIPTMFLIDKTGKVREIGHIGPTLADSVKKLLDEPEAK